ncbi:MAG: twin-arginine translocation signal domain-containing protein, partial [Chloroflexi bacterium]|nr:twin-arginine translocation signal domain-containing protein [Chloroflexota bacterium]
MGASGTPVQDDGWASLLERNGLFVMSRISRRTFIKGSGAIAAGLGLSRLVPLPNFNRALSTAARTYSTFEDVYRQKWTWDKVTWGTHLV